jgi:hypothetical protein
MLPRLSIPSSEASCQDAQMEGAGRPRGNGLGYVVDGQCSSTGDTLQNAASSED